MQKCTLFFLCFWFINFNANATQYRSASSGDWNLPQAWQAYTSTWTTATQPPGPNDQVTIRSGHGIQIITADAQAQAIHIESGAYLQLAGISLSISINNGQAGADFIVEGTFQDDAGSGAGNGTFFNGGATWKLGTNGTMIKTNNSSAARYRDFYENGMNSIPASANWIIRYTGAGSPSFTTNNTFYPNLIFESTAGPWFPASGFSRFQGISSTATIYGNLDIGGSGSGNVTIINENTYSAPIQINGAVIIKSGSTLTNMGNTSGTGFAIRGPLGVSGHLLISGTSGILRLNGFGTQQISGEGSINLSNLEVSNPNGVNLLRPLEVNNNLALSIGKITLNAFDLTVLGTITGASSTAYVQTNGIGATAGGLIQPVNGSTFFPIGNNSYNLAIITYNGGGQFKARVEDVVWSDGTEGSPILHNVVGRTWMIDGAVNSLFSLTLQWNAFDQRPGFDPDLCYISQHAGSGWSAELPGPAAGFGPFTKTRNGISKTGAFALGSGGILPVALTYFHAEAVDNKVQLEWGTEQETNFSHFEIQRSKTGHRFETIGKVYGAGNVVTPQEYSYKDLHPNPGTNYYRLKQIDFDGTFEYSPIKVVTLSSINPSIRIFPTIAHDQLTLDLGSAITGSIQIRNPSGRIFYTLPLSENQTTLQLDISPLPPGVYLLILNNKAERHSLRFIKV